MASVAFDPFEALGLPRNASGQAIKQRYHQLARKYHPNRHQGSDEAKATLAEHFHNIHQAWKLLSKADNRRRRVELLNLLELQDEMLAHFVDLLNADTPEERHDEKHEHSELEGNISSDADEDLPNVGLQRRQTFAKRNTHVAHLGDQPDGTNPSSPTSPTKKHVRILSNLVKRSHSKAEQKRGSDYFTLRRKKLEKLRRKELEAFIDYRNAMVSKFEAEEEAERQQEHYERAKWKREYFERAPRGTTERMRSFQQFMGAVAAFGDHGHAQRRGSLPGGFSVMSPVVGPGEGGQFLFPDSHLARGKSVHKRGWSSDISGDQSDSSEDSGDAHVRGRISPPGRWNHYSRSSQEHVSFDAFRQSGKPMPSAPPGQVNPDGPFKLVVRQPTDLGMIRENQDSSGETQSGSSRSPSPAGQSNGMELMRFTWMPTRGTSEIFGASSERRERSPSPGPRRHSSYTDSNGDAMQVIDEGCHFTTKQIGIPHNTYIPREHVHLLNRVEKARILGVEPDPEENVDPVRLLERLHALNAEVASKYMVKPDFKDSFNFRLIYPYRQIATRQHQSFIALSYRRKLQVAETEHHFTLPLEKEIFQAVWEERLENEGLWIDQICIKQDDREETTISMSAMDMVYRSARLVVVALDDIELEAHEGELLQNHMNEYSAMVHVAPRQRFRRKQPPYLESHENLFRVVRKMLRSSWFKRAWCRHEMRLAKHHIFLIPCKKPGTWSGRDVLRFNGKTIAHLLDLATEVPFEPDVEAVKPALHAFFRDRSKMAPDERQMRLHHGNFSTVVAEVFAMDAGGDPRIPLAQREADARKDKIAIILNTMECGLAIHERLRDPHIMLSQTECFHDLMLLSLAAQDPGALCSVGAPLPITDASHSWIYTPTVADAGLNNSKTLHRLPDRAGFVTNTSGTEHWIELDLKFLKGNAADRLLPDEDAHKMASHFIKWCEEKKLGRNRKRYLLRDRTANLLFGPMPEVYEQTLACVFTCGPEWMSDVCQRYSMSRWKVDLQGAYELLVALANTHGRWPTSAWSERAAGFIMDFVNFLIIRGLPQRQVQKPEKWRPRAVKTGPGGKVLTFVPLSNPHIQPAIPTVLVNADYVHLARLWILEPRHSLGLGEDPENNSEWTLLGKSVLFSDELSIGAMSSYGGDFVVQQRVFGRHRSAQSKGTAEPARISRN
ncbi:Chaperone protein DnaJ [Pseudocercospora fuligena]|uniref:Chaperone protein DnaJ n=1 Tax=Pseudocercospora fuligena TaxID=685502 RepID=A0A8H6RAT9_9PEZI|nr:Chaperone protein DnaJ [Pseudocercospora fuligena]